MDPAYEYLTTKNGEKVRSKSEKILADMFFDNGLVYKYEKPLQIRGNLTLYPDFTFFNPLTDQEIYWEHFGMMDDPQYVNNFIQKITSLNKNGIILGKNLIVTFESSRKILDQDYVKTLINSYLSTCK